MIGRVTMEDGTPPPKSVGILRVCDGGTVVETRTDKQGRFVMKRVSSGGIEVWSAAATLVARSN